MRKPTKYKIVLQREKDGGYVVTVPALPGCVSQGDTRGLALKNIKEAIELYIEDVRAARVLPVTNHKSPVPRSLC